METGIVLKGTNDGATNAKGADNNMSLYQKDDLNHLRTGTYKDKLNELLDEAGSKINRGDLSDNDKKALAGMSHYIHQFLDGLTPYSGNDSLKDPNLTKLNVFGETISSYRLHEIAVHNPEYQEIVDRAFRDGTLKDLSAIFVCDEKYFGIDPIDPRYNKAMIDYYEHFKLDITAKDVMLKNPLEIYYADLSSSIRHCMAFGLPPKAVLSPEKNPLLTLNSEALGWLLTHRKECAGFEILKVNVASYVQNWLDKYADINLNYDNPDPNKASGAAWRTIFSGISPEDGAVFGLEKRYPDRDIWMLGNGLQANKLL